MKTSIFETLHKLKLTSLETRKLYSNRTRDVDNLKVWKDDISGVIYIDDFYTGDETYNDGNYREEELDIFSLGKIDMKGQLMPNVDFSLIYNL